MRHSTAVVSPQQAPGPRGEWLLGSLRPFRRDPLGTIAQSFASYGDLVRLRLGPREVHLLSHPDLAHEVFVARPHDFVKLEQQRGFGIVLGNGLLSNGEHESWLRQRRMIQPMFHRQRLATMAEAMVAACERLLDRWQPVAATGGSVDIHAEMMRVTLDVITRTMFSADVLGAAGKIGPAMKLATEVIFDRAQNPFSPPLHWPTPRNRAFWRAARTLDQIVRTLIDQRQRSGPARGDLLDMLLEARDAETGAAMTPQQVRDEVITIFAAGHETTSAALTWMWYLLARHPQQLARLQAEVDAVLGGRAPTMADLPRLPYLQHVFSETQRLYPSGPLIPRRAAADTTLWGYRIPAQSLLFLCIYNIHRHPAFWSAPATFDPDRWASGQAERRHRLAFLPFGAGPHICIGNHFALLEAHLLTALIVQRFELRLPPDHRLEPEVAITLRPRRGLRMTLHPRGA